MSYSITNSINAFKESSGLIPGGVNSPVRAFKSVGGNPIFIKRGNGSEIYDIDDNEYTDYCMSWGALILGHAHKEVISSVKKVIENGTSFGCPTTLETDLAQLIVKAYPSIDKLRFVNSGTEATMSAIRLARGFSGRNKIIKFDGCYHGHSDHLLVSSGSGVSELAESSSKGVPKETISNTISMAFNDTALFEKIIKKHYNEIACVIIEPVPANMGLIIPKIEFLKKIRELTRKYEIILIFDEVISGFRVAYGGAQELFDIKPDMTCLGKIIGGGFPVGSFGGRSDIMDFLAPLGDVYQAGTLSGNPVAMAAGIATLSTLQNASIYKDLDAKMLHLKQNLKAECNFNSIGSVFCIYFGIVGFPSDYNDILQCNPELFRNYHQYLLKNGIYISPSQFEVNFISMSHTTNDLNRFIETVNRFNIIN